MYTTKEYHKCGKKSGAIFLGADPQREKTQRGEEDVKRQFYTNPSKRGNAGYPGVLFSKPAESEKREPFQDSSQYRIRFPPETRKRGFGSNDCPKTDEFMNGYRAGQYKSTLKKDFVDEKRRNYQHGAIPGQVEALKGKLASLEEKYPELNTRRDPETDFVGNVSKVLYNIGNTESGTTQVFLKDKKDCFYSQKRCKELGKGRHVPPAATSASEYGRDLPNLNKILTAIPRQQAQPLEKDTCHLFTESM